MLQVEYEEGDFDFQDTVEDLEVTLRDAFGQPSSMLPCGVLPFVWKVVRTRNFKWARGTWVFEAYEPSDYLVYGGPLSDSGVDSEDGSDEEIWNDASNNSADMDSEDSSDQE